MTRRYDVVFSMPWAGPLLRQGAGSIAGGAEKQILLVADGIADRGLSVALAVVGTREELPVRFGRLDVLHQPHPSRVRGLAGVGHDAGTLRVLTRHRARCVVQRNASRSVAMAAVAAWLRGGRFVYSSANVVDFDFGRLERRAVNVRLYEWGVRAADEVVVQTDEQAAMCRERFGRDPVVIRSIATPVAVREAEPDVFLWIGRLVGYKRPEVFVELARAVPEARFAMVAVAGADADPQLAALIEGADRELENFSLLEPRPREELMVLVERAVAIVNTSDYEGMPNVFLEGFARGVPAVAFVHDPDGIVARHELGAFAAGDPGRLAEQARGLWEHRHDQAALAERCQRYLRDHHDADVAITRWIDALGLRRAA